MHCKQLQWLRLERNSESFLLFFFDLSQTTNETDLPSFSLVQQMWRAWPGKAKFQDHAARKSESPSVFEWVLEEVKYVAAHVQKGEKKKNMTAATLSKVSQAWS